MYSTYNIPQYNRNMQSYSSPRYSSYNNSSSGDRFIGGGFVAPFLLGGIAGSLLTPRQNFPIYTPGPPIGFYPPFRPYPYYSSTYNYY